MASSSQSQVRQNYPEECEALINKQINMELYAGYVYMSMAFHFDRDDVALEGFHKFFKKSSDEEREHAQMFMKYQNQRGGRIVLQDVNKPNKNEWGTGALEAVEAALQLEKTVNQSILALHEAASRNNDPHLCDFLESNFLTEQVEAIKELADLVTRMKRAGDGLGLHIINKEMLDKE